VTSSGTDGADGSEGFVKGPERVVYRGRVIELVVGEFTSPDGERFEREMIHHPGAVCAVPIDGDEVIFVRQFRAPLNRPLLEIPAGVRDVDGEPLEETAARELAEEIGMIPGRLEHLCSFHNAPGYADEHITIFLATDLTPTASAAHGAEEQHMTIERVRLDDVDGLISSGELTDAKSLIGLLLARQRLDGVKRS
jgi:ADP-ribose pyrophosphatase